MCFGSGSQILIETIRTRISEPQPVERLQIPSRAPTLSSSTATASCEAFAFTNAVRWALMYLGSLRFGWVDARARTPCPK